MSQFNPHKNKTSNGVEIVEGLRVRDYDYRIGTVTGDQRSACGPDNTYCAGDHWFDVTRDGLSGYSMMNGERLRALKTRVTESGEAQTYYDGSWHTDPKTEA